MDVIHLSTFSSHASVRPVRLSQNSPMAPIKRGARVLGRGGGRGTRDESRGTWEGRGRGT